MRHADNVTFESEEDGWQLHVLDDQGQLHRFHIHDLAWELAQHAHETIGAWRAEGESVRRGMRAATGDDLSASEVEDEVSAGLQLERLRDSGALDLTRDLRREK